MTMPCDEVWASPDNLLCFDGHVLEVFGLVDTHRFRAVGGITVTVTDGKRPRCTVKPKLGAQLTFFCDAERIDELRAFAERLAAATA